MNYKRSQYVTGPLINSQVGLLLHQGLFEPSIGHTALWTCRCLSSEYRRMAAGNAFAYAADRSQTLSRRRVKIAMTDGFGMLLAFVVFTTKP